MSAGAPPTLLHACRYRAICHGATRGARSPSSRREQTAQKTASEQAWWLGFTKLTLHAAQLSSYGFGTVSPARTVSRLNLFLFMLSCSGLQRRVYVNDIYTPRSRGPHFVLTPGFVSDCRKLTCGLAWHPLPGARVWASGPPRASTPKR